METIPFEDFIPNWYQFEESEEEKAAQQREALKSKFISALQAAGAKPEGQQSGKATLKPKGK